MRNLFARQTFTSLPMMISILLSTLSLGASAFAAEEAPYAKCVRCHQTTGRSWVEEVSSIGGQNREYLIKQLEDFKSGHRKERLLHVMNDIARQLSRYEIERIAGYFSQQNSRADAPALNPMTEIEERLYKVGKFHSVVCLTCHGDAEVRPARRSDWPYISGQTRPAMLIQLRAFATRKRTHPMMKILTIPPFNQPEVIEGLALYFSRQPSPVPAVKK